MKISIITVCKNSEIHIEKSIQSVISQTYKNIEYIIIDGASSNKTRGITNKYISHILALLGLGGKSYNTIQFGRFYKSRILAAKGF